MVKFNMELLRKAYKRWKESRSEQINFRETSPEEIKKLLDKRAKEMSLQSSLRNNSRIEEKYKDG